MSPLNHQLLAVIAVMVLLGIIGLMAAFLERTVPEAEWPPQPTDLTPYAGPEQYRMEYAALMRLLRRMREEVERERDRESKSPATPSVR